ncbi:MAG TPA: hypothetical protein VGM56_15640 [Byssovorax sp.]|jgi:hypothetical protein
MRQKFTGNEDLLKNFGELSAQLRLEKIRKGGAHEVTAKHRPQPIDRRIELPHLGLGRAANRALRAVCSNEPISELTRSRSVEDEVLFRRQIPIVGHTLEAASVRLEFELRDNTRRGLGLRRLERGVGPRSVSLLTKGELSAKLYSLRRPEVRPRFHDIRDELRCDVDPAREGGDGLQHRRLTEPILADEHSPHPRRTVGRKNCTSTSRRSLSRSMRRRSRYTRGRMPQPNVPRDAAMN